MKAHFARGLLITLTLCRGLEAQTGFDREGGFLRGVDLSYVNEMEDNGGVYRQGGQAVDPFELFAKAGANLTRARLWLDADWTEYSDLEDVAKTFKRARKAGMALLLDFHYSGEWADPSKQFVPRSWKELDQAGLEKALYDYTRASLGALAEAGCLPEFVQVGNEINSGIIKATPKLDWRHDAPLLKAGLRAVRDEATARRAVILSILHIAQPQNGQWFFRQAAQQGISDFDIIGLSYYPQWSSYTVEQTGKAVAELRGEFGKGVMILETAYPWTLDRAPETAGNILTQGIRGYPISVQGQLAFLTDLCRAVKANGGLGVVYWEPAWISTKARTRWGQGSHWENAAFFDFKNGNEATAALGFLSAPLD